MESNYAIDTAARFGEIPFVAFTKELVTGVFDSLVEAHILQMEEYATFVNAMTTDLSTYINNTVDDVSFDQISDFILRYQLPKVDPAIIATALGKLQTPPNDTDRPTLPDSSANPSDATKWWGGLMNTLAPVVRGLIDKIPDKNKITGLDAFDAYNQEVMKGAGVAANKVPTYKDIQASIAALIASNKYSLLQNMVKQGMMRLVVTEAEIETKITFSTWNNSVSGSEQTHSDKEKVKSASNNFKGGGIIGIFKGARSFSRDVNKTITVNTAKSYQRDTSGTKVDIFGRVLIRFKTDYLPLNGF